MVRGQRKHQLLYDRPHEANHEQLLRRSARLQPSTTRPAPVECEGGKDKRQRACEVGFFTSLACWGRRLKVCETLSNLLIRQNACTSWLRRTVSASHISPSNSQLCRSMLASKCSCFAGSALVKDYKLLLSLMIVFAARTCMMRRT